MEVRTPTLPEVFVWRELLPRVTLLKKHISLKQVFGLGDIPKGKQVSPSCTVAQSETSSKSASPSKYSRSM
jgi:hypothetical protein